MPLFVVSVVVEYMNQYLDRESPRPSVCMLSCYEHMTQEHSKVGSAIIPLGNLVAVGELEKRQKWKCD